MSKATEKEIAEETSTEKSQAAETKQETKQAPENDAKEIKPKSKMTPLEKAEAELAELKAERTGFYEVPQFTFDDLKFVKNKIHRAEWKGGNEAFLMTTVAFGLEGAVMKYDPNNQEKDAEDPGPIQLQAGVIEGALYFLNRIESKGPDSAQKFVGTFFKLQNAMSQFSHMDPIIKELDEHVKTLRQKEAEKEAAKAKKKTSKKSEKSKESSK